MFPSASASIGATSIMPSHQRSRETWDFLFDDQIRKHLQLLESTVSSSRVSPPHRWARLRTIFDRIYDDIELDCLLLCSNDRPGAGR